METAVKRRALIVEDEVLISVIAAEALEEFGFIAVEVGSAKAAMDAARSTNFAVALVDIGLPDQRGDKLVVDLWKLHSELPIIVATGYADDAVHDQFRNAQRVVVLNKPYDVSHIHAALNSLALV